ncbi:MAG TPA: hypothetical protein VKX96_08060 [Chloroflexota bacterium]|nr:hypothetical protein [Chloroflexota bacterium]
MDLIAGTVVLTSVFLLATAFVGHWIGRVPLPSSDAEDAIGEHAMFRRSRTLMITLLIGYFVGISDVLVSAQLPAIAVINLAIGAATVAILYDISQRRRSAGEEENWRR